MQPIQPSPQIPAQQTIVYVIPQPIDDKPIVDAHASRRSVVNGIFQIIVGAFCIIVNSISLGIGMGWGSIGHGYWGGIFYIVTGSLGIAAGKKMLKCLIFASMVLCIIAASLIAPGHVTASMAGSCNFFGYQDSVNFQPTIATPRMNPIGYGTPTAQSYLTQHYNYYQHYQHSNYYNRYWGEFGTQVALSVLGVIEFALAVWGSTIWCKIVGCCSNENQTATPVQLVQISNGQPIVLVQASGGQYVPQNIQPPQYSSYPDPANQGYHMPEKVQPNNHDDVANPGPVGTYQRFA